MHEVRTIFSLQAELHTADEISQHMIGDLGWHPYPSGKAVPEELARFRIHELETDLDGSAGYTDQLLGLCHLLGYSRMPRLTVSKQTPYKVDCTKHYGRLDEVFQGAVDLARISPLAFTHVIPNGAYFVRQPAPENREEHHRHVGLMDVGRESAV